MESQDSWESGGGGGWRRRAAELFAAAKKDKAAAAAGAGCGAAGGEGEGGAAAADAVEVPNVDMEATLRLLLNAQLDHKRKVLSDAAAAAFLSDMQPRILAVLEQEALTPAALVERLAKRLATLVAHRHDAPMPQSNRAEGLGWSSATIHDLMRRELDAGLKAMEAVLRSGKAAAAPAALGKGLNAHADEDAFWAKGRSLDRETREDADEDMVPSARPYGEAPLSLPLSLPLPLPSPLAVPGGEEDGEDDSEDESDAAGGKSDSDKEEGESRPAPKRTRVGSSDSEDSEDSEDSDG